MHKTVLLTRPLHQASTLEKRLQAQGYKTLVLPSIEIKTVAVPLNIQPVDIIIVTSANALLHLPPNLKEILSHHKIIAIGPATKKALEAQGFHQIITPNQFNSEGILALDIFKKPQDILILTGKNSSIFLKPQLKDKGHQVQVVETYERVLPKIDWSVTWPRLQENKIDWIVSTSLESLRNLVMLFSVKEDYRHWLLQQNLMVIKSAMKNWGLEQGWKGSILTAKNPTDEAIIATIA